MLICPDCEMEVDKLTKNNRCKQCDIRVTNSLNRGKEYIKLKDLKEINPSEYNRAMSRRKSSKQKNKIESSLKETKSDLTYDLVVIGREAKDEVSEDIEDFFRKKGISRVLQNPPLEAIFEWFYSLCQEDNFVKDLDLERQCYDTLIVNYMHELKTPSDDDLLYTKIGRKIGIIQQKRTPVDNELDKYKILEPVFNYLKKDSKFMQLLQDNRIALLNLLSKQKDPKYISDTPSMQKYDYVMKPVDESEPIVRKISSPNRQNRYSIKITKVKNLYGNPNYQEFIYNRSIFADSPEEAKSDFLNYLRRDFPNLIYNTNDIVVSLYSEKDCL